MKIKEIADDSVTVEWQSIDGAQAYRVYLADADTPTMVYKKMTETADCTYTLHKATHVPHYFKLSYVKDGKEYMLD